MIGEKKREEEYCSRESREKGELHATSGAKGQEKVRASRIYDTYICIRYRELVKRFLPLFAFLSKYIVCLQSA